MKKKTAARLSLSRETLRRLTIHNLPQVIGASYGPSQCASWCSEIGDCGSVYPITYTCQGPGCDTLMD